MLDQELITHLHPLVSVEKNVYEATSMNGVTYIVVFKVHGHDTTFAMINKIYVIMGFHGSGVHVAILMVITWSL